MFDKAIENLEDSLNKDLSWRKKELANLRNELDSKFKSNQEFSFLVRGFIALIYAHWEGSVKSQLTSYIKFLNKLLKDEYLNINNYDEKILDLLFYPTIKIFTQNSAEKRLKGIDNFKKLYFNKEIMEIDSNEVINTKSNLSLEILQNLLNKFDIESIDNIEKKFIEKLLNDRNAIAHGEKRYSNATKNLKEQIDNSSEKVEMLITEIKCNILKKAFKYKK